VTTNVAASDILLLNTSNVPADIVSRTASLTSWWCISIDLTSPTAFAGMNMNLVAWLHLAGLDLPTGQCRYQRWYMNPEQGCEAVMLPAFLGL